MQDDRALIVLSGGLDSTTVLAYAKQLHNSIDCISFQYGQRHDREVQAAKKIAEFYNCDHFVQDVYLGKGGVLMDHDAEMPHMTYEEISQAEGQSPTYVPFRNGSFLSLAASHALARDCSWIYAGMHAEDARNWAYPDCTPEFVGAMQNAIYVGTDHKVRLVVPLQYQTKAQVVRLGLTLQAPYNLTMSCYEGTVPACGQCPTCISRLEAFKANDVKDPIRYKFDEYRRG